MSHFFSRMLWGFVFILLDINIFIDILPDIIGYFLIAGALAKLTNVSSAMVARKVAIVLGLLSIWEMSIFKSLIDLLPGVLPSILNIVLMLTILIYYYYIFKVCFELLQYTPHITYTKKVKYFYLITLWFTMIIPYIAMHLSEHDVVLIAGSGIVIYYIALITFLIYLMNCNIKRNTRKSK